MIDPVEQLRRYVALIRESVRNLSFTESMPDGTYPTAGFRAQFAAEQQRRHDTAAFRLRRLLPTLGRADLARAVAHPDPDVRRTAASELGRRAKEGHLRNEP